MWNFSALLLCFINPCCNNEAYFLMIQVHADGTKIRRSVAKPLPELSKQHQDSLKLRFVYAVSTLWCFPLVEVREWFPHGRTSSLLSILCSLCDGQYNYVLGSISQHRSGVRTLLAIWPGCQQKCDLPILRFYKTLLHLELCVLSFL